MNPHHLLSARAGPQRRTAIVYQSTLRCNLAAGAKDGLAEARQLLLDALRLQSRDLLGRPLEELVGIETRYAWRFDSDPLSILMVEDFKKAEDGEYSPVAFRSVWADERLADRRWQMDASLRHADDVTILDTRLSCSVRPDAGTSGPPRQVPAFLLDIADAKLLFDGSLTLGRVARRVRTPQEVAALVAALEDPGRRLPIVVVSEPTAMDIPEVERALYGAAHLFVMSVEMTFVLSDTVGRYYSVFGGAARVYGSPFTGYGDAYAHPLLLARSLTTSADGGLAALVERTFRQTVLIASAQSDGDERLDAEGLLHELEHPRAAAPAPAVSLLTQEVRLEAPSATEQPAPTKDAAPEQTLQQQLEAALSQVTVLRAEIAGLQAELGEREREFTRQEEDLAAVLDENSRLRQQHAANADASREGRTDPLPGIRSKPLRTLLLSVQSLLTDLQAADADFLALEGERTQARREVFSLEQRLAAMRPAEEAAAAVAYPEVLNADSVRAWIRDHHADRLVLHPRAARAVDKHDYGYPERAYRALDLLAVDYRNMRMREVGDGVARQVFLKRLEDEGLELSEAITDTGFGQFSEHYMIDYGGERRRIDLHVKSRTKSFDPVRTLRVYFLWDPDKKLVVLCHLPSHLDNTRT